jgi:non-lysosomal glucosylceramidase
MADQLCGDFYARLLGLPAVVADARAHSALKAVKEACFEGFQGGRLGVANGLRRDSTPSTPTAPTRWRCGLASTSAWRPTTA